MIKNVFKHILWIRNYLVKKLGQLIGTTRHNIYGIFAWFRELFSKFKLFSLPAYRNESKINYEEFVVLYYFESVNWDDHFAPFW